MDFSEALRKQQLDVRLHLINFCNRYQDVCHSFSKHKLVSFVDIKLKLGVVVAHNHPQHLVQQISCKLQISVSLRISVSGCVRAHPCLCVCATVGHS